jgi:ADP-heptose:LPS heptosyltransferase
MTTPAALPPQLPTCLVLRALYLGDLLTGLPALSMLRSALPRHRVVLAAPLPVGTLAIRAGVVDALLPSQELAPLTGRSAPASVDIAVDLHGNGPASRDLLAAHRPRRLISYAAGPLIWRQEEHEVIRWCRLVAAAFGIAPPWPGVRGLLPPPAIDVLPGSVIIHPGAKSAARRWPQDRFAAVARALVAAGQPVVVTGGPGEEALAERIAIQADARLEVGRSLDELFGLVAAARLVICGDTGVGHVAAAFGTPSVHLFGPVPPSEWGPPDDATHLVLYRGYPGYRGDPHGTVPDAALLKITVDDVLLAATAQLEGISYARHG